MSRCAVVTLLVTAARLAAQDTPLDAFRANIAAIHARDRAAYLSRYLHTPALARVGPDGLRQGYDDFARSTGAGWPDTLVATHLRIVPVSPDVAYGVYRYRVVDSSGSARGVSERVFVRTPAGWRVAVTTAFPAASVPPPPMALVGGTLVDGTGAAPLANAVVVMRGGRIACAGSRAACPVPADADTVSAAGKWIIPGLIDAHVHFSQTGWVDGRPDALDLRDRYPYEQVEAELHATPERFYRSYLCSGVTAVFDVGGYPWTLELQERTARSTTAPRVVAAGPLLSTIDFWLNLPDQRQFIYMSDETTVRAAVRAHKAWGAAAVKVWYIMPPQPPGPHAGPGAGEPQARARRRDSGGARHRRRQPAHATWRFGVRGARGDASGRAQARGRPARGDPHRGACGGGRPRQRRHAHRGCRRGPRGAGRRSARRHPERASHRTGHPERRDLHAARARVSVIAAC